MKYGRYARVSFTHGVLSIHISSWALSGASHEIGLEGAPFLFPCAGSGRALLWWRRGKRRKGDLMADEKAILFSDVLNELVQFLNQFKEPTFKKEELERMGIVTDLRNLPCTFNLSFSDHSKIKRISSEMKHVLKSRTTTCRENETHITDEEYLPYVEVGVEAQVSTKSGWKDFFKAIGALTGIACTVFILIKLLGWLTVQRAVVEGGLTTRFSMGTNVLYSVETQYDRKVLK